MRKDLTFFDAIVIIALATLAIIHFGVIEPIAHDICVKELAL